MNRDKEGVPDFVLMEQITEDAMMKNIKIRFQTDNIYTYIGNVVVSINPYKRMDHIYNSKKIDEYRGRYMYEVPPHVYALSNDVYRNLLQHQENQCVIISGESGAGKTEASKILMQYIAAVSKSSKEVDRVKGQLIDSNPILEAFGNAKTIRNDNSSRFGKYMEIQFEADGSPVGGKITNYLLEKSRVVNRAKGERSFHIFYQMLSGCTPQELTEMKLVNNPGQYYYLSHSDCVKVDTINDQADFKIVQKALDTLGFTKEDKTSMLRILAGILHLGNISISTGNLGKVVVDNENVVETAASLFGCEGLILKKALVARTISTGVGKRQSIINVPLDAQQAIYTRDALAKAIYERLFNWIVEKINSRLACKTPGNKLVVGVLDIYGFEVFENNSFEQFTINLCNEKLQQLFIELTLKSEQEEYEREGIKWEKIDYFNNKIIVDLIEGKLGIISLLDECCLLADSTDTTFLDRCINNYGKHAHFETYKTTQDRKIPDGAFRLKHYAGDVTYNVSGFLDKNKDTLYVDLVNCMLTSNNPLVLQLFPPPDLNSKKRPITAAIQFKYALQALMEKLLSCEPHYIRCIKPNDNKKPGVLDEQRVRHQVRYLGLVENVRVRRAGFAFRSTYERFMWRYKMLSKRTWPRWNGDAKSGTQALLDDHKIKPDEYRMGKTKVFIRNPTTLFFFEEEREKKIPYIVTLMQSAYRGYVCRAKWAQRKAAIRIQLFYRKYKFFKYFRTLEKTFKDVKKDPNYGKYIKWPQHPKILDHGVVLLHKVQNNWWAKMKVTALTAEQQAFMRQKILAYEIFRGNKKWNVPRKFDSDYLEQDSNPTKDKYVAQMQNLFNKYGDTSISFADYCNKVNRVGKTQKVGIVITEKNIYKHDPKSYKVIKFATPIVEVVSVSLSTKQDSFIVVKCKEHYRDLLLDAGINGEERYSEFIVCLCQEYKKLTGNVLPVNFEDKIAYNNSRAKGKKGEDCFLTFEQTSDPKIAKGQCMFKSGKGNVNIIQYNI